MTADWKDLASGAVIFLSVEISDSVKVICSYELQMVSKSNLLSKIPLTVTHARDNIILEFAHVSYVMSSIQTSRLLISAFLPL
jgi:hypothetical protein